MRRRACNSCLRCHSRAVLIPSESGIGDGNFKDSFGLFSAELGWRMQDEPPEGVSDLRGFDGVLVGDVGLVGSDRSSRRAVLDVGLIAAHGLYARCEVRDRG